MGVLKRFDRNTTVFCPMFLQWTDNVVSPKKPLSTHSVTIASADGKLSGVADIRCQLVSPSDGSAGEISITSPPGDSVIVVFGGEVT